VLFGVSRAGYYAWRTRDESARQQQDRKLLVQVRKEFHDSGGTYGSPRVQRALQARGVAVSRRRVERLMREAGLKARVARVYRSKPGRRRMFEKHANLLWREVAQAPGQIWVSDVTYVRVAGRWRFLAMVMDQYSRRLLGWSVGRVRSGELTRAALDQALRRAQHRPRLIFHSDRGSEYAGATLGDRLRRLCIRQSMTRGGAPGDNAHAESFFHTLKAELVHGTAFTHDHQLQRALRSYMRFYNFKRLHSELGYRSPAQAEHDAQRLASRSTRAA
jgi:transposase InsO family protein